MPYSPVLAEAARATAAARLRSHESRHGRWVLCSSPVSGVARQPNVWRGARPTCAANKPIWSSSLARRSLHRCKCIALAPAGDAVYDGTMPCSCSWQARCVYAVASHPCSRSRNRCRDANLLPRCLRLRATRGDHLVHFTSRRRAISCSCEKCVPHHWPPRRSECSGRAAAVRTESARCTCAPVGLRRAARAHPWSARMPCIFSREPSFKRCLGDTSFFAGKQADLWHASVFGLSKVEEASYPSGGWGGEE